VENPELLFRVDEVRELNMILPKERAKRKEGERDLYCILLASVQTIRGTMKARGGGSQWPMVAERRTIVGNMTIECAEDCGVLRKSQDDAS